MNDMIQRRELARRLDNDRRSKFVGRKHRQPLKMHERETAPAGDDKQPLLGGKENCAPPSRNEETEAEEMETASTLKYQSLLPLNQPQQVPAGGGDVIARPSYTTSLTPFLSSPPPPSPRPFVPRLSKVVIKSRHLSSSSGKRNEVTESNLFFLSVYVMAIFLNV